MRICLDLVMGLNFAVDYLLLLGTNQLMGTRSPKGQCLLAAAFGAVYGGLCLLPGMEPLGNWFARLVVLGLMGFWAFGMNVSGLKRIGVFILLTMALGGVAEGLAGRGSAYALLCAGGIWALCVLSGGERTSQRQYIKVEIREGEESVSVMALIDSGNSLKDPITGSQVLVIGPEEAGKLTGLTTADLLDPAGTLVRNPKEKFRLIPYNSVGGRGFLLGKRFGDVYLDKRKCSAVVAFSPETIGRGEMFQALAGGMLG